MWHQLIIKLLEIVSAFTIYVFARWLLGIASPQEDIAMVQAWPIFSIDPGFYRGLEYLHQIRARLVWKRSYREVNT